MVYTDPYTYLPSEDENKSEEEQIDVSVTIAMRLENYNRMVQDLRAALEDARKEEKHNKNLETQVSELKKRNELIEKSNDLLANAFARLDMNTKADFARKHEAENEVVFWKDKAETLKKTCATAIEESKALRLKCETIQSDHYADYQRRAREGTFIQNHYFSHHDNRTQVRNTFVFGYAQKCEDNYPESDGS